MRKHVASHTKGEWGFMAGFLAWEGGSKVSGFGLTIVLKFLGERIQVSSPPLCIKPWGGEGEGRGGEGPR